MPFHGFSFDDVTQRLKLLSTVSYRGGRQGSVPAAGRVSHMGFARIRSGQQESSHVSNLAHDYLLGTHDVQLNGRQS